MFPTFAPRPLVTDLSEYTLRPYTDADYDSLIEMIASRFVDVGNSLDFDDTDKDIADINHYWREPGGEFMVLVHCGEVIGSLAIRPLKDRHFAAELDWFFFRKEYEGKGLSLLLLKWVMQWGLAHHIHFLELWTSEKRKLAHKIYRKLGFVDNGTKKVYHQNPPQYLLFFELELTPAVYAHAERLFSKV